MYRSAVACRFFIPCNFLHLCSISDDFLDHFRSLLWQLQVDCLKHLVSFVFVELIENLPLFSVRFMELSYPRTFVPGNESSTLELSFARVKLAWNFRSVTLIIIAPLTYSPGAVQE